MTSKKENVSSTSTTSRGLWWWPSAVVVLVAMVVVRNAHTKAITMDRVHAMIRLAQLSSEDWAAYYKSLDQVMIKGKIENEEDEQLVGAWYRVINIFCDLGNLEKMYIPPIVDPSEQDLQANQILIENKMALGAASLSWNDTFVNAVGDTLPLEYRQRFVLEAATGDKLILPVGTTDVPSGFQMRDMDIVDLGCGKGRILHDMIRYTGGKGIGLNIDQSQLENGIQFAKRQKLWPHKLELLHGTFNDPLPFADASQDFVYEVGAFTYLMDKLAVFREIFRVLRPGGAFCYNDWTVLEGFDPDNEEQASKLVDIRKISGLIELHQPEELAALAQQAGFEVVWNGHGGYKANPSSGLLGNMHESFWFVDTIMEFSIQYNILPAGLKKAWRQMRLPGGNNTLLQAMDEKWLDVGHIFLIRKPFPDEKVETPDEEVETKEE